MAWTYHGGGVPAGSPNPVIDGNIVATGFLDAAQIGRTWQAHIFSLSGDGTIGNPWTGWESSVNALPANVHLHFVGGYFAQSTMVTMKRGWLVTGDGIDNTIITCAMTGTAFRTNFAVPGSNPAYVAVRDLFLVCTNISNIGTGLLETNGTVVEFSNVKVQGFRYGIAMVGTEIGRIDHCETRHQTRAGIWIVNGNSYNLTNADIDLSANPTFTTNVITISNCQINQLGFGAPPADTNPRAVGIAHDGGWTFEIDNCNFNGCTSQLLLAGVGWANIKACEWEGSTDDCIVIGFNKLNADGGSGPSGPVTLDDNLVVAGVVTKFALRINGASRLVLINNLLRQGSSQASGIVGCANVNYIHNFNSFTDVVGATLFDVSPPASVDLTPNSSGTIADLIQSGNFLSTLYVRNNDAVDTGAASRLVIRADVSAVDIRSHGTARVATRWGVTIARWNELLATDGNGLAVGTQTAVPLILGTNSVARMSISGAGVVSIFALPIFANNAAAITGGLIAGGLYRTGADPDVVSVVH